MLHYLFNDLFCAIVGKLIFGSSDAREDQVVDVSSRQARGTRKLLISLMEVVSTRAGSVLATSNTQHLRFAYVERRHEQAGAHHAPAHALERTAVRYDPVPNALQVLRDVD
jgi:hypothetical protein